MMTAEEDATTFLKVAKQTLKDEIKRLEKLPPYEDDGDGICHLARLNMAKARLARIEEGDDAGT